MPKKLLYEKIYQHYKERIISGILAPEMRLPSEREIADDFEVSRITVTRALNELETDKYIHRVQGSGSFVTNHEWKTEQSELLSIISLVLPFHDEFSSEILKGIEDVAKKNDYFLTFHNSKINPSYEKEIIEDIISKGSHGIILYPTQPFNNMELYSQLIINNFPLILIDRRIPGLEDLSLVSVDNKNGFYKITDHLIKLGHKKIILIAPEVNEISSEYERYKGFCKAHIDNGIPLLKKHLYSYEDLDLNEDKFENYRKNDPFLERVGNFLLDMIEELDEEEKPTAVAAINDVTANEIMKVLLKRGYSIPKDYSITGFDNLSFASHLPIPLTTVSQPAYKIGKIAAEELFTKIKSPEKVMRSHKIDAELIIRESTEKLI